MPPLPEPKIRRILTLTAQGWPVRRIAREVGVSPTTVVRYLRLGGQGTPNAQEGRDAKR